MLVIFRENSVSRVRFNLTQTGLTDFLNSHQCNISR